MAAILIDLGLTPGQCRHDLFTTADTIGGGVNQYTGWGQMNCWRALAAIRPASSLSAVAGTDQVALTWVAPQTTAFTTADYLISRATTSGGPYGPVGYTPNGTTLTYTDTSLNPGTSYYYIVQAVDAQGNTTVPSNEVSSTALGTTWTVTPTPTATPDYGEFTNWTFTGLWHPVEDGVSPCANSYSHPWATYYGQASDCAYDTGGPNTGTLTSPISYIVCNPTDTLNFEGWWQSDGGDTLSAQYAPTGTNSWTTLWSTSTTSSGGWVAESVPLAAVTLSPISVRFLVTTDSSANTSRGWYIDDVSIPNCLTPSATPTQTFTISPTPTLSPIPTSTLTPTTTPTLTPTDSPTITPTPTDSPCMVNGLTCTPTATPTPTLNPATLIYNPVAYPNPVWGNQVTFNYQLFTQADTVTIKIFTVAYRKVAEITGSPNAGDNNVVDSLSGLANGLYFYVIEAHAGERKEEKVGKLILVR